MWASFSEKGCYKISQDIVWATLWATFLQKHPVALMASEIHAA
jgi:hypothetical protein